MKTLLITTCLVVAPLYCKAADAPSNLEGKTVVLNYTRAEFRTEMIDSPATRWIHYAKIHGNASEEAFSTCGLTPKATRNLTPIRRSGIYSYKKIGQQVGEITVDMYKSKQVDVVRSVTLTFLTPTSGTATEEIAHGDYTGKVRNITFTVQ